MSEFEYVLAIPAIVVALAMSELLTSWARLLRSDTTIEWDYLAAGWSVFFVVSAAYLWIGNWDYHAVVEANALSVLAMLLPPVLLLPVSVLLSPAVPPSGALSLREHYFRVAPRVFPIAVAYLVSSSLVDVVLLDRTLAPGGAFSFLFGLPLLVLVWARAPWVHAGLLVVYLGAQVVIGAAA